jgi:hypothetical protein
VLWCGALGRLSLDYDFNKLLDVGATLVAASSTYLHGDENNANVAGGTNGEGAFVSPVTGSGSIPSDMVVNLHGTHHLGKNIDLFARAVRGGVRLRF